MSDNNQIKEHISTAEREKWNKVVADFAAHLGSKGVNNHALADGTTAGFSQSNFTPAEKTKLAGIADGALNNPHRKTHPYTMIEGLSTVGHTGSYKDLLDQPTKMTADGGNADTVGGIRITIDTKAPTNPVVNKEIWLDTANRLIKTYTTTGWISMRAVWG